jgi:hypothetical protein
VHILRYIFPRQFGLHNVFSSNVDSRETAMPFKDYTLREQEIHQSMCRALHEQSTDAEEIRRWKLRVPRRLRGVAITLVKKLRALNQQCSYFELLRHYCPVEVNSSILCWSSVRRVDQPRVCPCRPNPIREEDHWSNQSRRLASRTWRVRRRMCLLSAAPSRPKSSLWTSWETIPTLASSCIG